MIRFFRFLSLVLLISAGCSSPVANTDSAGETIVCFGDSITAGYGAGPNESYPALLGLKVKEEVINAGVSGETTTAGRNRIEKDVLSHNPRIVIVEFGGNDFLYQVPREETFRNIDQIIEMIQSHGAMVVLATVKTGIFTDAYSQRFKEIARKRKALWIPDIMRGIFDHPEFKSDEIHPNAEGYRMIAQRIYKEIKPLLNPRISVDAGSRN